MYYYSNYYTVDLVIFVCFIFREFLILGLFMKRYNKSNFSRDSSIREFVSLARIKTSRILPDLQYIIQCNIIVQ